MTERCSVGDSVSDDEIREYCSFARVTFRTTCDGWMDDSIKDVRSSETDGWRGKNSKRWRFGPSDYGRGIKHASQIERMEA